MIFAAERPVYRKSIHGHTNFISVHVHAHSIWLLIPVFPDLVKCMSYSHGTHKILGPSPLGNNYYRWDVAIDVSTVEEAIMSNQKVIYMFITSYDSHSIKVYHPFIKNTSVSIWWMCISALRHYHGKHGIVCFSRLLKTWQEFLSPCEVG